MQNDETRLGIITTKRRGVEMLGVLFRAYGPRKCESCGRRYTRTYKGRAWVHVCEMGVQG